MGGPHWAATPGPSCLPTGLHTFRGLPQDPANQQEASHLFPEEPRAAGCTCPSLALCSSTPDGAQVITGRGLSCRPLPA